VETWTSKQLRQLRVQEEQKPRSDAGLFYLLMEGQPMKKPTGDLGPVRVTFGSPGEASAEYMGINFPKGKDEIESGFVGFICGFTLLGGALLLVVVAMDSGGFRPAGPGWITLPILAGLTGSAIARDQYLKWLLRKAQGSSRPSN
jgi:hypothetical protein